jgi:hypothetical protein
MVTDITDHPASQFKIIRNKPARHIATDNITEQAPKILMPSI